MWLSQCTSFSPKFSTTVHLKSHRINTSCNHLRRWYRLAIFVSLNWWRVPLIVEGRCSALAYGRSEALWRWLGVAGVHRLDVWARPRRSQLETDPAILLANPWPGHRCFSGRLLYAGRYEIEHCHVAGFHSSRRKEAAWGLKTSFTYVAAFTFPFMNTRFVHPNWDMPTQIWRLPPPHRLYRWIQWSLRRFPLARHTRTRPSSRLTLTFDSSLKNTWPHCRRFNRKCCVDLCSRCWRCLGVSMSPFFGRRALNPVP